MTGVLYRAMFGAYDYLPRFEENDTQIQKILFTDSQDYKIDGYEQIVLDRDNRSPLMQNRQLKFMAHPAILDYEWSLYVDSNIWIAKGLDPILCSFVESNCEYGAFSHVAGRTVGEELLQCVRMGQITTQDVDEYLEGADPSELSLTIYDNSIIFRRKEWFYSELKDQWYAATEKLPRDQVHLPRLLKKYQTSTKVLQLRQRDKKNPYFVVFPHLPSKEKNIYKRFFSMFFYFRKLSSYFFKKMSKYRPHEIL